MLKIISVFIAILTQIWAADPLIRLYRTQGIEAVERALENRLQEQGYWEEIVSKKDVALGYYEAFPLIATVDKSGKKLQLYDTKTNEFTPLLTHEIITGIAGDKQKEGDLKTPIGVYDLLKRFVPSDTFYGQVAYALSYPNTLDKQKEKQVMGFGYTAIR